jgi:hypothetical protein
MTELDLKERLSACVGERPCKMWLVRRSGHRLEFVWSLGPEQLEATVEVANWGPYHLMGQGVAGDVAEQVKSLFAEFCRGEEAQRNAPGDRKLRAAPGRR